MTHIFISYSREDEARIQPLAQALKNRGFSVFWDRHIPAGKTWRSYIGTALSDADCIIVAWSRHSTASNWVCEEAEEGRQRGNLVPILLDNVAPPMGFRSIQAADLTTWEPDYQSPLFDQLLRDIAAVLNVAPTLPPSEGLAERDQNILPQLRKPVSQQPKATLRRFAYALTTVLLILAAGSAYWIYQQWLARVDIYPLKVAAQPTGRKTPSGQEYKFTIFVNSTPDVLRGIRQVQYDFKNSTFKDQLVVAMNIEDRFSTSYVGWGCLTSIAVKVSLKDGTSQAFDFNMCESLGPKWRE